MLLFYPMCSFNEKIYINMLMMTSDHIIPLNEISNNKDFKQK